MSESPSRIMAFINWLNEPFFTTRIATSAERIATAVEDLATSAERVSDAWLQSRNAAAATYSAAVTTAASKICTAFAITFAGTFVGCAAIAALTAVAMAYILKDDAPAPGKPGPAGAAPASDSAGTATS